MTSSPLPQQADLGAALLRAPTPEECETLAAALAAMPPWSVLGIPAAALAKVLSAEDAGVRRYAIVADGALAGTMSVRYPWLKGPYVELLAILPEFQGNGFGEAALRFVERETLRLGARSLWVCASHFNDRALSFYGRCGFVAVARLPDLVADGFDEILLRKKLA